MPETTITPEVEAFLGTVADAAYRTWFTVNKYGDCVYCGESYLHCDHEDDECGCTGHASYCPLEPFIAAYWAMVESDNPDTKAFVARYVRKQGGDA